MTGQLSLPILWRTASHRKSAVSHPSKTFVAVKHDGGKGRQAPAKGTIEYKKNTVERPLPLNGILIWETAACRPS